MCVFTLLCNHLLFLYRADTVLRIEYDDLSAFYIGKACKCSLTCIAACRCQDNDLVLYLILLSAACHKMRQDWQCHILECDRCTVKQLQIISTIRISKRCNDICIKFLIICFIDTAFQFFFREVCQVQLHYFICNFLIGHPGQLFHRYFQRWNMIRYK